MSEQQQAMYRPIKAKDLPELKAQYELLAVNRGEHTIGSLFKSEDPYPLAALMVLAITHAEMFSVTKEMTELARHAGKTLVDDFQISNSDIPSRAGIIIFEDPISDGVRPGSWEITPIIGVLWAYMGFDVPDSPIVSLFWLHDNDHPNGKQFSDNVELTRSQRLRHGRLGLSGYSQMLADGVIHGEHPVGGDTQGYSDDDLQEYKTLIRNLKATLKASWLLMSQTFVNVTETSIGRPVRERKGKTKKPPKVKIIALRKQTTKPTNNNNGDPTPANFDYRFIVRGHWRMQPYGPGRKRVRPVWIAPFIKGPEDKPLKVVDKVYHLKR